MTTWMSDLNSEHVPSIWRLVHPTTKHVKLVCNNGTLGNLLVKQSYQDRGYELDDNIFSAIVEDVTDGQ